MKCPKCRTALPEDANFCLKCGHTLVEVAETKTSGMPFEGERKHATVFFSDLSGYTAMTEKLDPEEVKEIMSRIFAEIA